MAYIVAAFGKPFPLAEIAMKGLFLYSFIALLLFSCKENSGVTHRANPYRISYKQLEADTAIREAIFSNGYFFCVQANYKIAVFDTGYNRVKSLEDSLNIFPIAGLYSKEDTVFIMQYDPDLLGYPKNEFYFTKTYKIQKRKYLIKKSNWPVNSWPLLQDSIYDIYANHTGSGGFLVFFFNRLTKKTYCTWSWAPRQVLKFANYFYIAEEGDYNISPGFRKVSDPVNLIEVSDIDAVKLKQLFQHLVSPPSPISYYRNLADSIKKSAIPPYGSSERIPHFSIPVYTFVKNNSLFTIINCDSSINLVTHKTDSLFLVQTILDTSFKMDRFSYDSVNKNHFITFEISGGRMIDGEMQDYSNFGFLLIKDSTIDVRQFYIHKPYPR